jgi:hypothetical protein
MNNEIAVRAKIWSRSQAFHIGFVALLVLSILPFWWWPYFPSQDGPSHLHNAAVIANYPVTPLYHDYYRVAFSPAGNFVGHLFLAAGMKFASAFAAERLLLTIYAVSFAFAFLYFIRAVAPDDRCFSYFVFLLIHNTFLYLGFWNFCLSIPACLVTLGYVSRAANRSDLRPVLFTAILTALTYLAHMFSWAILVLAATVILVVPPLVKTDRSSPGGAADRLPAVVPRAFLWLAIVMPGLLAWSYQSSSNHQIGYAIEGWWTRLWFVYALSFLSGFGNTEFLVVKAIAALTALLAMFGIWAHAIRKPRKLFNSLFLLSLLLTAIAMVVPDSYGTGSYIRMRVVLYAYVFLIAGLAPGHRFERFAPGICGAVACLTIAGAAARIAPYRYWNSVLTEFVSVTKEIAPGSTILPLRLPGRHPYDGIQVTAHALGWMAPKPFVDLQNYEAAQDYFPVRFRTERSPVPMLGTDSLYPHLPYLANVSRYESATGGSVDYLFVEQPPGAPSTVAADIARALQDPPGYDLIFVSKPTGLVRLYKKRR